MVCQFVTSFLTFNFGCVVGPVAAVTAFLNKDRHPKEDCGADDTSASAGRGGNYSSKHNWIFCWFCLRWAASCMCTRFEVADLPNMLAAIIQLRYILHIQFPENAPSLHCFLCHVMGERKEDIKLSKTQKELVSKVGWTYTDRYTLLHLYLNMGCHTT